MNSLNKTFLPTKGSKNRNWFIIDCKDQKLGRLATVLVALLRGKVKPQYHPSIDTGDYIIVINAEKVAVTGNKESDKNYYSHTGFPGGLRTITLGKLREKAPERILQRAVKGMLPHNPLGRAMLKKLRVFVGPEHTHAAQQPKVLEI